MWLKSVHNEIVSRIALHQAIVSGANTLNFHIKNTDKYTTKFLLSVAPSTLFSSIRLKIQLNPLPSTVYSKRFLLMSEEFRAYDLQK